MVKLLIDENQLMARYLAYKANGLMGFLRGIPGSLPNVPVTKALKCIKIRPQINANPEISTSTKFFWLLLVMILIVLSYFSIQLLPLFMFRKFSIIYVSCLCFLCLRIVPAVHRVEAQEVLKKVENRFSVNDGPESSRRWKSVRQTDRRKDRQTGKCTETDIVTCIRMNSDIIIQTDKYRQTVVQSDWS